MSHAPHESLPGYSPAQILKDGCELCMNRAASRGLGIDALDSGTFEHAWKRAAQWERGGCDDISQAEAPMLSALWAIQVQFEKRGVPIGVVPDGVFVVLSPAETGADLALAGGELG